MARVTVEKQHATHPPSPAPRDRREPFPWQTWREEGIARRPPGPPSPRRTPCSVAALPHEPLPDLPPQPPMLMQALDMRKRVSRVPGIGAKNPLFGRDSRLLASWGGVSSSIGAAPTPSPRVRAICNTNASASPCLHRLRSWHPKWRRLRPWRCRARWFRWEST